MVGSLVRWFVGRLECESWRLVRWKGSMGEGERVTGRKRGGRQSVDRKGQLAAYGRLDEWEERIDR